MALRFGQAAKEQLENELKAVSREVIVGMIFIIISLHSVL